MENGTESRDVLGDSRKRYWGPWAEVGKYLPGKEPIRLQDSLPYTLKKKKNLDRWRVVEYVEKKYGGAESNPHCMIWNLEVNN